MADKGTKFRMKIRLGYEIEKVDKDGTLTPFCKLEGAELTYDGMDLLQVTATEQGILNLPQGLLDFGWASAEMVGFPEAKAAKELAKGKV